MGNFREGMKFEFSFEIGIESINSICLTIYFLALTAAAAYVYQLYF